MHSKFIDFYNKYLEGDNNDDLWLDDSVKVFCIVKLFYTVNT